ncbi:MAG: tetratricopeptide repeat protein [Candidatus Hodarchaeota archaeon]
MNVPSIEKADKYLKDQDYIKALSILKRILQKDPKNIAALTMSALIYKTLGRYIKAINNFKNVVLLNPDHTGALLNLATLYNYIEDNDKAIKIYEALSKTSPELIKLSISLAGLYNKTQQYDKAIECLEKYLEYNPSDSIGWFELGVSYRGKNDLQRFKDYFNKAHKLEFEVNNIESEKKEIPSKSTKSKISDWIWFIFLLGMSIFGIVLWWDYFITTMPLFWIPFIIIWSLIIVCAFLRRIKNVYDKKEMLREELANSYKNFNRWQKMIDFHRMAHQYEKVIKLCEYALLVLPSESNLYLTLGNAYLNINFNSKAIDICKKGIEIDPNNASLLILLGVAYFKNKQHTKAESILESALAVAPNNLQTNQAYGNILFKNRKYDECSRNLTHALTLINEEIKRLLWKLPQTEFPIQNYSMMRITISASKAEEMRKNYKKLFDYIKYKIQVCHTLGSALLKLREFDKVEEIAKDSLNVMENSMAYNLLSSLHFLLEDYPKAIEVCYKALSIDKEQKNIRISLIGCYFESGDMTKALDIINELIQKDPEDELLWNELGYIFSKTGEYEKATEALNKAIQINYKFANPWNHLGYIEYKRGNFEKALNLIKKSMKKDPDYARAPFYLAEVLFSLGKTDEALVYCDECLKIAPNFKKAKILREKIKYSN